MVKKHNYPKRNPRKPYGKWYKTVEIVGIEKLNEIFSRIGMYKASTEISSLAGNPVSPAIARYIRNKLKRVGDKNG